MKRKALTGAAGPAFADVTLAAKAAEGIPFRNVADMFRRVLASDLEVVFRMMLRRLRVERRVLTASERFEKEKPLPLPLLMFRFGAETAADTTENPSCALLEHFFVDKENGRGLTLAWNGLAACRQKSARGVLR